MLRPALSSYRPAAWSLLQVQAFDGPKDPMVADSSTPGNGGSSSGGSSGGSGEPKVQAFSGTSSDGSSSGSSVSQDCGDVAPPGTYTCEQQKVGRGNIAVLAWPKMSCRTSVRWPCQKISPAACCRQAVLAMLTACHPACLPCTNSPANHQI